MGGIGFRYERAISVPGLVDSISILTFAPADSVHAPLLLASDGRTAIIYSTEKDTLLFKQIVARKGESCTNLMLIDINRDHAQDLVCGLHSKGAFRVLVFDGKSQFAETTSVRITHGLESRCAEPPEYLQAVDLDRDSFPELLMSVDSSVVSGTPLGETRLYYSFPDSLLWKIDQPIRSATDLTMADKSKLLWAEPSFCAKPRYNITKKLSSVANAIAVTWDGAIGSFGLGYPNPCGPRPPQFHSIEPKLWLHRYDQDRYTQTEMITEVLREFHCGDDTTTQTRRTLTYFMAFNQTTLEHVWSWDIQDPYTNFMFIPGFADYFFAFDLQALVMFRLSDGKPVTRLDQVPESFRDWVYPTRDSIPQLVCLKGNVMTLYSLDVTTDSPEDSDNGLPVRFELGPLVPLAAGKGYAITVDIPFDGKLTLEILDQTGKVIETLWDSRVRQAKKSLEWNTSEQISGTYTVRATFEKQIRSRKLLVLK
jgi:hypothetical protein